MNQPALLHDIKLLIKSRYGLIHLVTSDEEHAGNVLAQVAVSLHIPFYEWSSTKGLRRDGISGAIYETEKMVKALQNIQAMRQSAVYYFEGLGNSLEDPNITQLLKDTVENMSQRQGAIAFSGFQAQPPDSLKPFYAEVIVPAPTIEDYKKVAYRLLKELNSRMPIKVELNSDEGLQMLTNLKGLTLFEAEKILTRVIVDDNRLALDDIPKIIAAKKDILTKNSLLEFYSAEESLADIADLEGLKSWLSKRKQIISQPDQAKAFGLTFPRGILLLGVQGCGKSMCAKAISKEWGLPLLKLDPSNMYSKWAGESEQNFKRAMNTAERMSPVILWIDEIEKAFSSSGGEDSDGGVSKRIFGSFLGWMQEHRTDVFIVATANNIDQLPPELMRKGRFDEIFFVDLPNDETRRSVFNLHLKKRKRDSREFDLAKLSAATDGFSPAEIEQTIVSGLYSAFANKEPLTTDLLMKEIGLTRPLSETMREKVSALREWAKERTVPAN